MVTVLLDAAVCVHSVKVCRTVWCCCVVQTVSSVYTSRVSTVWLCLVPAAQFVLVVWRTGVHWRQCLSL